MQFSIQIGDGSGLTPSITSIDLLTATIWAGLASTDWPADGGSDPQFASRAIFTDIPGDFVDANGRLATVTDVAAVVLFLASPMADYLNGVTIDINGGSWFQ